jgi:hypothetical protein
MVGYPPDTVLGGARIHFARHWPHAGEIRRARATVEFRGEGDGGRRKRRRRRTLRLLATVGLGVLTLGIYPAGRYLLGRRARAGYWAEVFARKDESGTLVVLSAGKERYLRLLELWVREELGGQPVHDRTI